jgi:hypothetical protein
MHAFEMLIVDRHVNHRVSAMRSRAGRALRGAGDRVKLRDQILIDLRTPILFVRATPDALCPLDRGASTWS